MALAISTTLVDSTGSPTTAPIPQGQVGAIQVTLTNQTQQAASGVALRLALPLGLRYLSTLSIAEQGGSVRTAAVDPPADSAVPIWGAWTIPPSVPGNPALVSLTIQVQAQGSPGRYRLTPVVLTAATSAQQDGSTITVAVRPAPSLALTLRATPAIATAGTIVTYLATITNSGSGTAAGTVLSLTLPEGFTYLGTQSVGGTASVQGATQPIVGSTIPVWAGYDVPGAGGSGPGLLTLEFQAQIGATVPQGSYAVGGSIISGAGTAVATLQNVAALAPVSVP